MKVYEYPHCCGAAIFAGFSEKYQDGTYYYEGNMISERAYIDVIERNMHLARHPEDGRGEWTFGTKSVLYAIVADHQHNVKRILSRLGWEKEGKSVTNVNTGHKLQSYVYHVK